MKLLGGGFRYFYVQPLLGHFVTVGSNLMAMAGDGQTFGRWISWTAGEVKASEVPTSIH